MTAGIRSASLKPTKALKHGNRNGVGRAVDELLRRIEQRADGRHDDRGVQPVLRRNAGDLRVGHGLRHGHGGHRQAGHRVAGEYVQGIIPQRIDCGNPPLDPITQ